MLSLDHINSTGTL